MAKYPCQGHSDDEHSHNQKEVVQQLLIKQDNGSYECYIINIIPYQECEISAADIASTFTISNGMQGFSGFVAYHQLNGEVVKVEGFDNGIKQKSMPYNPNDRNAILTLTKNVKLYPDTYKLYDEDVQKDYQALKNYFTDKILAFKATNSYLRLGEAFQPLLDCFLTVNQRIEYSIPYFCYTTPRSLITEMYMQPQWNKLEGCTSILKLYYFIQNLAPDVTSYQVGQLFEAWRMSYSQNDLS